jgi:hypothetical protein
MYSFWIVYVAGSKYNNVHQRSADELFFTVKI